MMYGFFSLFAVQVGASIGTDPFDFRIGLSVVLFLGTNLSLKLKIFDLRSLQSPSTDFLSFLATPFLHCRIVTISKEVNSILVLKNSGMSEI